MLIAWPVAVIAPSAFAKAFTSIERPYAAIAIPAPIKATDAPNASIPTALAVKAGPNKANIPANTAIPTPRPSIANWALVPALPSSIAA